MDGEGMSRYTRQEFSEVGIEPQKCDGTPFNAAPTAPETPDSYWFAYDYHTGYIDGYSDGARDGYSDGARDNQ